jgi:hypothetical protein
VVTWHADGAWSIKGQGRFGKVFEIAHVLVPEEEWGDIDHWDEAADAGALDNEEYSAAFPLRGTR